MNKWDEKTICGHHVGLGWLFKRLNEERRSIRWKGDQNDHRYAEFWRLPECELPPLLSLPGVAGSSTTC